MRRKSKAKKFKEQLDNQFSETVDAAMKRRHILMAPFPLDPEAVYAKMWSEEEREAIRVLSPRSMMRSARVLYFNVPTTGEGRARVSLSIGDEKPICASQSLEWGLFTKEEKQKIREWVRMWSQYARDTKNVQGAVADVVTVCNTLGQVARIWPDLVNFMSESQREVIKAMSVKAPYPREAMYVDNSGRSMPYERYAPARFEKMNMLLAEALMLPEIEGLTHIATHNLEGEINFDPADDIPL